MYAKKNEGTKIAEYIAKAFTNEDTVDIKVTADGDWYKNSMDEDCRDYKVQRWTRRHFDGKVIGGRDEFVRVVLEDADEDEHHVQIVSLA